MGQWVKLGLAGRFSYNGWILPHLWGGWLAVGWSKMAVTGWLGWPSWLSSLSGVHIDYIKSGHILMSCRVHVHKPDHTRSGNTHVFFKSLLANLLLTFCCPEQITWPSPESEWARLQNCRIQGYNLARPLPRAVSTINLPPGLQSQGLFSGPLLCGLILCFFFFFSFSRAAPAAYGGSQARGWIGAIAAGLHHSHSNTRSEPHLQPTPQHTATPDP